MKIAFKDSMRLPLLFSLLVIAAPLCGRFVLDHGVPLSVLQAGSTGMLLWIAAPLLLAWLARRLDPVVRGTQVLACTRRTVVDVLLVIAITIVALLIVLYAGLYFQMTNFMLTALPASVYVKTIASVLLFAFIEEYAWRGYLLPALLARVRYPVALLFGATMCFCWHFPYLDMLSSAYTNEPMSTLAPRVFFGLFALQWLAAELYRCQRVIWSAFAFHASFNAVATLAFVSGWRLVDEDAWLLSPSVDGVGVIVLMLGAAMGLYWRRARQAF